MRKITLAALALIVTTPVYAAGETAEFRSIEAKGFVPITTAATVIEDTAFLASNPYPGHAADLNIRISERRRNIDITSGASSAGAQ